MFHIKNIVLVIYINVYTLTTEADRRFVVEMDLEQELINLRNEVSALKQKLADTGSTYTRWGRTDCEGDGTTKVYSGYMAGTYMEKTGSGTYVENTGSGANYLCLAGEPTWDHYNENVNNLIRITSVEYEFHAHQTSTGHDLQDFFGSNIQDGEAPCAVCRAPRSTNVMIPGRTDCYSNWTKEYSGYLVGAYGGYNDASEYVCLDRRPEVVVGSGDNNDVNAVYFVESHCGKGLECPPYIHDRELACVVCSK